MNLNKTYTNITSWRLMLVGSHGSIVPLGPIKILLFALLFLLTLSLIGAAFLGFSYFDLKMDFADLAKTFSQQQEQIQILRDKRDMLMAKLVIAESKLASSDQTDQSVVSQSLEKDEDGDIGSMGGSSSEGEINLPSNASDSQDSAFIAAQISDFKISHSSETHTINASYILKNKSTDGKQLSGKCVLLLKGSINGESTTYPIPNVPWENGMPSAKQGRPFYIRNYMTVKLSRTAPDQDFSFDRGIIYVFETKGAVILKKEIPINLNYLEDSTSSPAKTSTKNSKDSDTAADIKDGTPSENESKHPTNESANSEALP